MFFPFSGFSIDPVDLSWGIQWFCFSSFLFLFVLMNVYCMVHDPISVHKAYVVTDFRVITIEQQFSCLIIRSIESKDFSDITIQGNDIIYLQERFTDPDGNQILNEWSLPTEQNGRELVAMLNALKEKGSSQNSTLEGRQPQFSINLHQMCPMVPPHTEEIINSELQAVERVVHTVMMTPKQSVFRYPFHAFSLGFGIYLLVVSIGVGLIPSMYFLIPLIFGLLVILLTIRSFRLALETVYGITDRRAIRIYSDRRLSCTYPPFYAFPSFQPYNIFRRIYPNGTGDVIFAHQWIANDMGSGFIRQDDGFFGVPNAKDIEKMLKDLARHISEPE